MCLLREDLLADVTLGRLAAFETQMVHLDVLGEVLELLATMWTHGGGLGRVVETGEVVLHSLLLQLNR